MVIIQLLKEWVTKDKEVFKINNKVLVQLFVPEIDKDFEVYLPINKKIGNVINLLNKAVYELSNEEFALSEKNVLYNVETKERYASDVLLFNTNIRNGTQLILLS